MASDHKARAAERSQPNAESENGWKVGAFETLDLVQLGEMHLLSPRFVSAYFSGIRNCIEYKRDTGQKVFSCRRFWSGGRSNPLMALPTANKTPISVAAATHHVLDRPNFLLGPTTYRLARINSTVNLCTRPMHMFLSCELFRSWMPATFQLSFNRSDLIPIPIGDW